MPLDHLTTLLPCHGLDDFSLERSTDEAAQLLAAWTAVWHPALLALTRAMPHWAPAETPPEQPEGHLILVPPCCESLLPSAWLATAEAAEACVVRGLQQREALVAAALAQFAPPSVVDAELVADFFALGYCHFVTELLTHQLRYMSNLDEGSLARETLAAADAAMQGNAEDARSRLQAAFDLLQTSREYYYGGQATLLDLTLVAATTLGPSLRGELAATTPHNLLISGEVLAAMALREPASLDALRLALKNGTVGLLGGEYRERELPLLPPEAIRYEIRRGLAAYQQHLGVRPTTFARRRFGLTPVLPQILRQLGFLATLHATLDDGRFPSSNQGRISWQGLDGTVVETLGRIPRDAARADTFLSHSRQLAAAMELDQSAAAVLAHWPLRQSPWCGDLVRAANYTGCLGKFDTLDHYFQQTTMTGQHIEYKADEYHSPYLQQAVAAGRADPISAWVRYYRRRAAAEAVQAFDTLSILTSPLSPRGRGVGGEGAATEDDLLAAVEESCGAADEELDTRLEQDVQRAIGRLAHAVTAQDSAERGTLIFNPCSFSRQICLEAGATAGLSSSAGLAEPALIDVPPLGFAWLPPTAEKPAVASAPARKWGLFRAAASGESPLAESRPGAAAGKGQSASPPQPVLRNEFFEIVIDPYTGAIRSLRDFHSRGPRLSQQMALRLPAGAEGTGDAAYSIMAADSVTITSSGPVLGEVVSRGRLMDRAGQRAAGFQQTTRIWRGSRVIEILIELAPEQLPGADPWSSYYAVRWAWSDEAANLYRSANMARVPTDVKQLEAPHFIDVCTEKTRTTLLTGGLPYHRRRGLRQLDTLLAVQGETARQFRVGIGVDLPASMAAGVGFLAPLTVQPAAAAPSPRSAWLFHLDARHVLATHWEAILDESGHRTAGFRVRLLETDGRAVQVNLRSFRAVRTAEKLGVGDLAATSLPIKGDSIAIDLGSHEWAEIEARF